MNKIMIVIPSLASGGAERVVSTLSNEWASYDEVHIVTFNNNSSFYKLDDKVILHDLNFSSPNNKLTRLFQILRASCNLRKLFNTVRPDFILSFITHSNVLVLLSLVFTSAKVIISERNSPSSFLGNRFSCIIKRLYRQADGIICQTDSFKKFSDQYIKIRSIAIGNPLSSFPRKKGVVKQKMILCVGRLVEQKGHIFLIKAFENLAKKNPEWKLNIVGEGPKKKELEILISELGLEENIFILDATSNIQDFYQSASIFCLTSLKEGFPNVLLEAMSFSCAPVSFDCETGPKELIIDSYNGFLVELGDVESLSERIDILINNENLRTKIGRNASLLKSEYACEAISKKYLEFCLN